MPPYQHCMYMYVIHHHVGSSSLNHNVWSIEGMSLFDGMEWWNGMVEWNSGMEWWDSGMTMPIEHVL